MENTTTFLLALLLVCSSSIVTVSSSRCSSRDRRVLRAIDAHFGSPASLSSWRAPGVACCEWAGVECYPWNDRVRNLNLINFNVSGTIPPTVGDLPELESLFISANPALVGSIPYSLTKLKKLVFLDLSNNSLSGPIPDYLSEVTTLTYLDLSFNKFSGSIPPSLPELRVGALVLDHNQLTGPIPDFSAFGDGNVFLSHNKLSGLIPTSLAGHGISIIDLSHNLLTGDASFLFGASTPATEILLQHNKLRFNLSTLTFPLSLLQLGLGHNYIYGSIPAQINQVTNFLIGGTSYQPAKLDLSYNLLCGPIPQGPVTAMFGVRSYIHNKCLCGKPLPPCK